MRTLKKDERKWSPHYSLISQQPVGHFHSRERKRRELESALDRTCQLLASVMTDCCATGALITIKRALSHTLFLLECLLGAAQRGYMHRRRHTHRGEALISGRKEYNEWVIKTQGRISDNLCPLSEHRSHDKGRISARLRRQALRAHWTDQTGSISAVLLRALLSLFFFYLIRGQTPLLIDNGYIVLHLFKASTTDHYAVII